VACYPHPHQTPGYIWDWRELDMGWCRMGWKPMDHHPLPSSPPTTLMGRDSESNFSLEDTVKWDIYSDICPPYNLMYPFANKLASCKTYATLYCSPSPRLDPTPESTVHASGSGVIG
jgi:hypothetical protein